jgi:hypothetical protein
VLSCSRRFFLSTRANVQDSAGLLADRMFRALNMRYAHMCLFTLKNVCICVLRHMHENLCTSILLSGIRGI